MNRPKLLDLFCGKELEPVGDWQDSFRQPWGAAEFVSHGHYGSQWDPGSRITMTLNVCDDCLTNNRLRVLLVTEKPQRPEYEYTEYKPFLAIPTEEKR